MLKRTISLFIFSIVLFSLPYAWGADRGEILSGETKVSLDITAPSYMDTWTFDGQEGDRVLISAVMTSGTLNTDIILYPPGGGAAVANSSSGDLVDYQLLDSGIYTIVIRDWFLDDTGGYDISLSKIPSDLRPGIYNPSPSICDIVCYLNGYFEWDAVNEATYDLYFGENVIEPLALIYPNLSAPSAPFPPGMELGKIYYWHVVAHTPTGDIQGPYWWFQTNCKASKYDFDGDGISDILWRHGTSGGVAMWLMDGATISSDLGVGVVSDTNWKIERVRDFNGDGKSDILWRHSTTGSVAMWLMNGAVISSDLGVGIVPDLGWQIQEAGDFNGDGKADILWRHSTTGSVAMWLMNGAVISSDLGVGIVGDLNWQIKEVGDFNGDSKADILWRHSTSGISSGTTTGMVAMWLMNGAAISSDLGVGIVGDLNWEIMN
jgi:hypothetical protein